MVLFTPDCSTLAGVLVQRLNYCIGVLVPDAALHYTSTHCFPYMTRIYTVGSVTSNVKEMDCQEMTPVSASAYHTVTNFTFC